MSKTVFKPQIEILRRVHIDGRFLEVGPSTVNPELVELRAYGDPNVDYFGPLRLTLSPEAMKKLGDALVDTAIERGA